MSVEAVFIFFGSKFGDFWRPRVEICNLVWVLENQMHAPRSMRSPGWLQIREDAMPGLQIALSRQRGIGSGRQGPVVAHVVFATLGRVLAQAELGGPDDFVFVQRGGGLVRVLALERFVKVVQIPRNGGGPSSHVLGRSLAGAAPGGSCVEDPVEERSEGR